MTFSKTRVHSGGWEGNRGGGGVMTNSTTRMYSEGWEGNREVEGGVMTNSLLKKHKKDLKIEHKNHLNMVC